MKILMVYPQFPDTFWSFRHALAFIGKKNNNPPLGLMTVSALLPGNWEKKLCDTNINPLSNSEIEWADIVFISAMDIQRKSCVEIIQKIKSYKKLIVAGGPLFSAEYENFPEIDHFVLNEGEITLPQFVFDIQNRNTLKRIYKTEQYADIRESPLPDLSLINFSDYECMSIQFSRGCPFHCDFCNVTTLLGHKPRMKTVDQVIGELDQLYNAGWRRNVFFVDDNFIGNKKYLKDFILPALIEWRKNKIGYSFITEASINLADDTELMDLMVKAGFTTAFIGIETPNVNSLIECHKDQNIERDLVKSVLIIHNAGIQVMAGFIVGFDNDTNDIFNQLISFIQDSGIVTAMVGLLQAPNGTELYKRLEKEGRILHEMSGDNADGSTNIATKMNSSTLRAGYQKVINSIYSPPFLYPRIKTLLRAYKMSTSPSKIYQNELIAFLKTVWVMGFNIREAKYYWNLLLWTVFRYPKKFSLAITLVIYGYHFRTVNKINHLDSNINPNPVEKLNISLSKVKNSQILTGE
ncbi:MAG: radical SAM protein [Chloroflexi bacterium]|nr:radical SAM protein [Chloroflexota bacterium]